MIFNNLVLVLVSLFGMVHLILVHDLSQAQLIGFSAIILILGLVIGVVILALRHQEHATAIAIRVAGYLVHLRRKPFDPVRLNKSIHNLFSTWETLHSGAWHGLAIGAVLNIGFDMLTLFFLFVATGHNVSPGVLLAGYGLPLLLGKMALVVTGGVGVVEGSMAALYDGLGVPDSVTVVVVLGYRLISFCCRICLAFQLPPIYNGQRGCCKRELINEPRIQRGEKRFNLTRINGFIFGV